VLSPDPVLVSTPLLAQNYPNPFNSGTSIRIELPRRENITLTVHNILGQRITTLYEGVAEPGIHTFQWGPGNTVWIPEATPDRPVASGVYFCRLAASGAVLTHNMLFIR
jgi:hypothetical protein